MKIQRALFCLLALSPLSALKAEQPKLVVAILVDQLRYDYLERFQHQFSENGFRMLTDHGAFLTFARYNYTPTVTAAGHASFLSGSTPSIHGIIGNDWYDKPTGKSVYCVRDEAVQGVGGIGGPAGQMSPHRFIGATLADQLRLHYRSSKVVGISLKDRGAILPAGKKPTGAYWFEAASGKFITSTYYQAELPEWVAQFNAKERPQSFVGHKWDRLLEESAYEREDNGPGEGSLPGEKTPTFPHQIEMSSKGGYENLLSSPFGNQLLLEFAEATIDGEQLGKGPQPDLLTVSFSSIDYIGHRFGPYSHEVQDLTLRLDRQLAELFSVLDKKVGLKNTVIVLTADHGVAPIPEFAKQEGLDGQRSDELQLMGDLLQKLGARFGEASLLLQRKMFNGHLYLNHETLREKKIPLEEVTTFIREWALNTGQYHNVYSREQLLAGQAPGLAGQLTINGYSAERSGDIVLVAKPYVINWTYPTGTTHGSPFSYDTHVPVLFYGEQFKPGRYAEEFFIADIVPTLSTILRIDLPPGSSGKPFVPAIKVP